MSRTRIAIVAAVALACPLSFAPGEETAARAASPETGAWTPLVRGVDHLSVAHGTIQGHAFRFRPDEVEMHVVPAADGHARIDAIASAMRDAVLNWPARVAGTIAADIRADPHLVQTLLQEHMHALLADVAARLDPPPAA